MFNMSSVVLDNSFKTLSPFIDALVNKNVCDSQFYSASKASFSWSIRSQTGIANKYFLSITSSYVII